jgi:hypothetical protein
MGGTEACPDSEESFRTGPHSKGGGKAITHKMRGGLS